MRAIAAVCSSMLGLSAIAVAGCVAPVGASSGYASADGGEPTIDPAPAAEASLDIAPEAVALPSGLPAPTIATDTRATTPSSTPLLACRVDAPAGTCDRCPDRACRQVRLSLSVPPGEAEWAQLCDEGDLVEEAEIACLCAGGDAITCERAAADTAQGIWLLNTMFGGVVPPVGTRYRDSAGLRQAVDQITHDWLAGVAGPPRVVRCDAPDREAAAHRYELLAQRVRLTGSCDE